ncbi:hypothetical protein COCNU_02G018580 [Cocos nucifera]|uniref:Uncharacterized protein n=1 Tax=Cocos nucifera TaxID=13894 RepID=A0A8K0I0L2_COCNU|nr:hypothetical protein COCNU_02G018580 [Cocos nucifera]
MPLLARLGRALRGSSFTSDEILSKIRELHRRYEEKCYKIRVGTAVGDFNVAAFEISNRIWGGGIAGAVTKKRRNKKKKKFRKKKIV